MHSGTLGLEQMEGRLKGGNQEVEEGGSERTTVLVLKEQTIVADMVGGNV